MSDCSGGRLLPMPGFYPIHGISDHWVHAFAAIGCRRSDGLELDLTERILPRVFAANDVRALLGTDRIVDGFSALALHLDFALLAPAPRG